jgi:predicted Zn-dependent peptidase
MAYIYEKKSLKMTGLYITYNRGGLYDVDGEYGTSHLMEHLICKTFKDEYSTLTKFNIEWNAYTSNEFVVVHFTGMDKYFTPEIKTLLVKKLLGGINIPREEFETEKKVVLREYTDSFNDPETMANLIREKYNFYGVIGRKKDIEKFSFEDMKHHYSLYYSKPSNIIEIGPTKTDFSFVEFDNTPSVKVRKLKYSDKNKNVEYEVLPENNKTTLRYLSKKMVSKSDYPALVTALIMLSSGLESPMYKRIREEKGLCYGLFGNTLPLVNEAALIFGATTDNEYKDTLNNEFEYFFDDVKKHLTQERFNDVIQSFMINDEENKIFRYDSVSDIIRKGYVMIGKSYKKLTLDKVKDIAAKYINNDNLKMFLINSKVKND